MTTIQKPKSLQVSSASLNDLPQTIARPQYDRSLLRPGLVHIGLGNFHRAHQAVYLNDLLNAGGDPAWGILGAGVREFDARTRGNLAKQDWLYTVVEVDGQSHKAVVNGAMLGFAPVQPDGNVPLIHAMSNPATKIVSLTVTEGGYFLNGEGAFNQDDADIVHDIRNPTAPRTAFGAILAALSARKAAGIAPFTVMSCDNLPGNGNITRKVVVGMASLMGSDFGKWVNEHVSFPNGMVDRITPATGDAERAWLSQEFGVEDRYPVFCEPFRQWVLEDKFFAGRPNLEDVGVTFTNDIESFELMKLRLLNGGHAILAYASAMIGIEYVHEAMATPILRSYLRNVLTQDVVPFVPSVPGFTPQAYLDQISSRFANPGVKDTIERLCFDGSSRQPKFIVDSIRDNLVAGKSPDGLALSSALWCQYCLGRTDRGEEIAANDPRWDNLQETARTAQLDSDAWLAQEEVYGSVGRDPRLRQAFLTQLTRLQANGTEETIRMYLNSIGDGQKI